MGKFTNTKYNNTLNNLISASKDKLANPYYKFNDKKPTEVVYYSQNVERSTIDESSGLFQDHLGKDSAIKFNKINNFIVYGIDTINTQYDVGDFGLESSDISGEIIVLPNTIIPRPGDFFYIPYIKEDVLFKIISVTPDTLDNGNNIYKMEYKLTNTDSKENINDQTVKEFEFIVNNVGTDFKTVITSTDYKIIKILENLIDNLIIYFETLFFDDRLQTFVFTHNHCNFYDPFFIEFLIRNKVLIYGSEYIYVSHATYVDKVFPIDYMNSIYYILESCNKSNINKINVLATGDLITDPNSLFITRMDEYYKLRYSDNTPAKTKVQLIDRDVLDHIESNTYYEKDNDKELYNLWIAYFNNNKDFISNEYIDLLSKINRINSKENFYYIGISIFIIEKFISSFIS